MMDEDSASTVLAFGRGVLHDEARALDALADGLGTSFEEAVDLIVRCSGKLIVSGLGKSGHVGRKIAATFASTGTTAVFLHLAEAIHGDLGMASEGDVAILISRSGETAELESVLDHFREARIPVIAITANAQSMLSQVAQAVLLLPAWREVGPEAVAPTTSTTMTLALGDALAMTVMHLKGFSRADFGRLHPGGALGARLKRVEHLMHSGARMPLTAAGSSMHDTIIEMTAKRLGIVGVVDDDGYLAGVITDGDLRRHMEEGLDHVASEFMTLDPKTIAPDALVDDALTLFEEHRITTLFVVRQVAERQRPLGVLHIHDCPSAR